MPTSEHVNEGRSGPVSAGLDWQEAHARLERARRALEAGNGSTGEEARVILRRRAEALAKPRAHAPATRELLEVLVLELGDERYGIPATHAMEVQQPGRLTPVPCTPGFVLGVVNHRGRILPVLDLRPLLGRPGRALLGEGRVVAVEAGGMTFGIAADAVEGPVRVDAQELGPPPAGAANRAALVYGVTREAIGLVDLEALARDPRILVNEGRNMS